ncbi:PstS family phosphate ABC transporter substrate-binding protein [Herpetosiphon llansteffanensis]|uniref:PstS family phosphate ABC transporter substrate-binding protein n=1 Tax=Herpetosiphon llansteffanensis TaxID=2094568 RepID=UPI000D7CADEC|nr:PstS family phosphate ABC transporter substrate-binding protein [Herpetosiphon llansteffanensis]
MLQRFLLLCCLLTLAGCGANTAQPTATSLPATATPPPTTFAQTTPSPVLTANPALRGSIVIDGSSTVFPITEAIARDFALIAPNVQVQLGVSGTGGGFKKFCAGETAISDASRPIKQSEAAECAANQIDFVEIPVAFDGLSLVTNPNNTWLECITLAELNTLWQPAATKSITSWQMVRSTWPTTTVQLYGAGQDSGTFDYFTSAIVGTEGSSRSDVISSEDDYLIAQDIAGNPNGLGYFGYAYYREYQDRLKLVAIDAGNGCVLPSEQTIADGSYQPLSRPIFIYVRADALDRAEVAAFVDFYLSDLPRVVAAVKYVPLPSRAYQFAQERVQQRKLGSMFEGGSQIGVSIERLLELEGE